MDVDAMEREGRGHVRVLREQSAISDVLNFHAESQDLL